MFEWISNPVVFFQIVFWLGVLGLIGQIITTLFHPNPAYKIGAFFMGGWQILLLCWYTHLKGVIEALPCW